MSKRLKKNKDHQAGHIIYMPQYYQGDFDKRELGTPEFYMNIGLYPCNSYDLLSYISGLKPSHIKDLKEEVSYTCPFSGNRYLGAYPVAYIASSRPELEPFKNEIEKHVFETVESFTDAAETYALNHIGDIGRSFMGHGYKAGDLNTDILTLGLTDIITRPNQNEQIIFKTWKRNS